MPARHLHFGAVNPAVEHLSVSSGNAQLLPLQYGDGIENQYPLPALSTSGQAPQQFPIPPVKLGSNDGSNHALESSKLRRQALKSRRSQHVDPDRPYLYHPKYLEYRSRPRQDIGEDGNPIWPDHIEAAFQDGKIASDCHYDPVDAKRRQLWFTSSPWVGKSARSEESHMAGICSSRSGFSEQRESNGKESKFRATYRFSSGFWTAFLNVCRGQLMTLDQADLCNRGSADEAR
jgi:hypothetical protein